MEYTDDNMQLVAEKVVLNMSLADLQAYVCEDYFFSSTKILSYLNIK